MKTGEVATDAFAGEIITIREPISVGKVFQARKSKTDYLRVTSKLLYVLLPKDFSKTDDSNEKMATSRASSLP